jgi:hypothetical protein
VDKEFKEAFEFWWESRGGDGWFYDQLDCASPSVLESHKKLFYAAFEAGGYEMDRSITL